jgi:hypothetical protein
MDEPRASRAQAKVVSASRTILTALPSPLRGSIEPARRPSRSFVPQSRYGPHAAVAEEQRSRGAPPWSSVGPTRPNLGRGRAVERNQGKQAQLAMMFRPGASRQPVDLPLSWAVVVLTVPLLDLVSAASKQVGTPEPQVTGYADWSPWPASRSRRVEDVHGHDRLLGILSALGTPPVPSPVLWSRTPSVR